MLSKLIDKFSFRPPAGQSFLANLYTLRLWCGPWLYALIRYPADWLCELLYFWALIENLIRKK